MSHLHKLIKAYAIHSIFLLVWMRQSENNILLKAVSTSYSFGLVLKCQCGLNSDSTWKKNESTVWRLENAHKERQTVLKQRRADRKRAEMSGKHNRRMLLCTVCKGWIRRQIVWLFCDSRLVVAVMVGSCQPRDADRNHQGYKRGAGNCDLWVAVSW